MAAFSYIRRLRSGTVSLVKSNETNSNEEGEAPKEMKSNSKDKKKNESPMEQISEADSSSSEEGED